MDNDKNRQEPAGEPRDGPYPTGLAAKEHEPETKTTNDAEDKSKSKFGQSNSKPKYCMSPFEFVSLLFSGLGFGTLIVVAVVYYCQLREMQKSTKAATLAATAAEKAANTSKEALDASIESFHLDQRAWVGLKQVGLLPMEEGKPLRALIVITNSGKTFALDLRYPGMLLPSGTLVDDAEKAEKSSAEYQTNVVPVAGALFPGEELAIPSATGNNLTKETIDGVKSGKIRIYLIGEIYYSDVFGQKHVTRYFELYDPESGHFQKQRTHGDAN